MKRSQNYSWPVLDIPICSPYTLSAPFGRPSPWKVTIGTGPDLPIRIGALLCLLPISQKKISNVRPFSYNVCPYAPLRGTPSGTRLWATHDTPWASVIEAALGGAGETRSFPRLSDHGTLRRARVGELEGLAGRFACLRWIVETGKRDLHGPLVADASHWCDALIYYSVAARSPRHPLTNWGFVLSPLIPAALSRLTHRTTGIVIRLFRGMPRTGHLYKHHQDQHHNLSPVTDHSSCLPGV